ncbi:unnamed protein product [Pseudo-nitzschia multistriata]|uniref:Pseudouridine synthase RsuA/RluA-like domain-containing protein n=1 Tax=Pseudo-nitzschia multistriata TaxID=183589 RepID=A0A448YUX4_9STRA|nr:unnamed protein product [Pseudo-nitzschia multistriata]
MRNFTKFLLVFAVLVIVLDLGFVQGFIACDKGSALQRDAMTRGKIKVRTVVAMSTVTPPKVSNCAKKEVRNDGENIGYGGSDNRHYKASDDGIPLQCPSSYPSKTFGASNIKVSYQRAEKDDINGDSGAQLLPLQRYHARNQNQYNGCTADQTIRETNDHPFSSVQNNATNSGSNFSRDNYTTKRKTMLVTHDIPDLDFIHDNLSRFRVSKSSQVLLEEYQNEKQSYRKNYPFDNEMMLDQDSSERERQKQALLLKGYRLRSKIRAECRASLALSIEETLKIIYCDSHICVVDKPSGVLSVPGHRRNPSLANLVYDTIDPSSYDTEGRIVNVDQTVVHRLDMATSGIIVYALSKDALQKLQGDFRDRRVQKTYQALVEGHGLLSSRDRTGDQSQTLRCCGTTEGEIDVALERDPKNPPYMRIAQTRAEKQYGGDADEQKHKFWREAPKPSKTTWSVLSYEHDNDGRPRTRLELRPHTGRTHQLRVHTSQVLGTPIVGDEIYGNGDGIAPLCLHARQLCLKHPISGADMVFEADPPF